MDTNSTILLSKTAEREEEVLRDFLYEVAYENIGLELGNKLYKMLEEDKNEN